ncbi:hypothetical protein D9758_016984 [Tetrapyrgos nigripes]|uniref:Nephrocystin 3-like N-terminal domain-containing protein n=1 Tax=Tetrapyrgos nigripes TaxID=182062 RepID=A0A8H5FHK6_9AGAR|nr:hypothetical protein D9758_016984 [Tetrapyrgos nigripes]
MSCCESSEDENDPQQGNNTIGGHHIGSQLRNNYAGQRQIQENSNTGVQTAVQLPLSLNFFPHASNFQVETINNAGGDIVQTTNNYNYMRTDETIEMLHILKEKLNPITNPTRKKDNCMEGTRVEILNDLCNWVMEDKTTIAWIYGIAGTGKSAIAVSLASKIRDMGKEVILGLTFHCVQGQETSDISNLVPTICYHLAQAIPEYGQRLCQIFEDVSLRADGIPLAEQLERFLQSSLLNSIQVSVKVVIIVDGLDEWGVKSDRAGLLSHFQTVFKQLSWLKLVVTSRPNREIIDIFLHDPAVKQVNLTDYISTNHDLRRLIVYKLPAISEDNIKILLKKANSLFIWITTALTFIEKGMDIEKRLGQIIGLQEQNSNENQPYQALYLLYETVLEESFSDPDNQKYFKTVMRMILTVTEPISLWMLGKMLGTSEIGLSPGVTSAVISQLSAVVYDRHGKLYYHLPFGEFLMTPENKFSIHPKIAHLQLAGACLEIMGKELRFNICHLNTSFFKNKEVKDPAIEDRIDLYISPELRYSCSGWTRHAKEAKVEPAGNTIQLTITDFMRSKWMILWLECMSVMGKSFSLKRCLEDISEWAKINKNKDAETLAEELYRIADTFGTVFFGKYTTYLPISIANAVPFQSIRESAVTAYQKPGHGKTTQTWGKNSQKK